VEYLRRSGFRAAIGSWREKLQ